MRINRTFLIILLMFVLLVCSCKNKRVDFDNTTTDLQSEHNQNSIIDKSVDSQTQQNGKSSDNSSESLNDYIESKQTSESKEENGISESSSDIQDSKNEFEGVNTENNETSTTIEEYDIEDQEDTSVGSDEESLPFSDDGSDSDEYTDSDDYDAEWDLTVEIQEGQSAGGL